jgi:hypothetical protein
MTDWTQPPTGEPDPLMLDPVDIETMRAALAQRGHEDVAKLVRDHYSARCMQPDTCVGYQGDNPMHLALEILAVLAAAQLAQINPNRTPAYQEGTFLEHLDLLRAQVQRLGELQRDLLLDDQVWYWPDVVTRSEATRESLVQDIRAQIQAEFATRYQQIHREGYVQGWKERAQKLAPDQ